MSVTITPYFTPTSITGCRLWLDGADPAGNGVIPANNSAISTWFDKSGNGNSVTQATSNNMPSFITNAVGGNPVIRFNGTTSSLTKSSFTSLGTNNLSFWMVEKNLVGSAGNGSAPWSFDSGPNSGIVFQQNGGLQPTSAAYNSATARIVFYNRTNTGSGDSVFINGSSAGSGDNATGSYGTTLVFGYRQVGGPLYSSGDLCEILFFIGTPSTGVRQQIEGYLAQKWGLTSSLPADHPGVTAILYRSSVPAPVRVTPYSFPASTIVYTGAFIPYTVPSNCTSITFNMWGAGGPGGSGGMPGGGGAYVTGKIAVTSGEALQLIVGRGGQYGTATQWSTMTNAEGGGGGGGGLSGQGGQGGGRTAIQKLVSGSYLEVVTAGGGGSAGGNAGTYGGNAYFSGTSQSAGTTYGQGRVPTGGSATAGGLNTFTARVGFPWDGTQFTGGFASNAFNVSPVTGACGGGGGGGGYYGGGGGGRSGADTYGGGGGGSYCNATYITNYSGSNGTSNVAVASGIAGYITGCGRGGNGGSTNNGSNGLIVLTPDIPNPIATFKSPFIAGGSSSSNGIYTVLTFSYPGGTLVVNRGISATFLIIGGGGGGGGAGAQTGGGGAGGAVYVSSPVTISAGSYTVTVGQGGPASTNGGNSTFFGYTGTGGGRGGNWINGAGASGGCGGGGSGEGGAGASGTQGFGGGSGRSQNTCGGGGGGMGSVGGTPNGGNGLAYSITGTSIVYAGGGGGNGGGGVGGTGGGGNATGNGTNGLGGGGGGGGGTGGHGVVIISYVFL